MLINLPPSVVTDLLESLVKSQNWVPAEAHPITERCEFPSPLQKIAAKATAVASTWRAWLGYDGIRFFASEMSLELAREHGCPALKVSYYNDEGRLQDYSTWLRRTGGKWQRCAV